MAREIDRDKIYAAAEEWSRGCLMRDGSIAGDASVWTKEYLEELDTYYVHNEDASKRDFMTKLEEQLAPASSGAKRLMAEMFWAMYLFTSSLRPPTKILKIRRVWEWSGQVFPENHSCMEVFSEGGIGSTGPGFQNYFWMETAYFVTLLLELKKKPEPDRKRILEDPWALAGFLDETDATNSRQLRHILLHLLFPDTFERISSWGVKKAILLEFSLPEEKRSLDFKDRAAMDRALLQLRSRLADEYGADFDYYRTTGLKERWMDKTQDGDADSGDTGRIGIPDRKIVLPEPYDKARFWSMAAGQNARLWKSFQERKAIAIGFEEFGPELSGLEESEIYDRLAAARTNGIKPTNDVLAAKEFTRVMQPGDYVFIKQGRAKLLGFGQITSDYRHDPDFPEYHHVRSVQWIKTGEWRLGDDRWIATKTLTEFTQYRDWIEYALALLGITRQGGDGITAAQPSPAYAGAELYALPDLVKDAFFDEGAIADFMTAWKRKKNLILVGPPGTGKSWLARRLAWLLLGAKDTRRLLSVQFHQSYSYEDFVRGWRPGAGGFVLADGPFLEFCEQARKNPGKEHVVLIDEINRGNLSRIFGELLSLLEDDKRSPEFAVRLGNQKPGEPDFHIPGNVYLLGTMNSADRSLAVVDYALRRRFAFRKLEPAYGRDEFNNYLSVSLGVEADVLARIDSLLPKLNEAISDDRNLGPDYRIGHSFFASMVDEIVPDLAWYENVVRGEILPLLEEYWFDEREKVQEWKEKLLS